MPRRPDSARSSRVNPYSRAKPWWELKPESYRGTTIRKMRDKYLVESPGWDTMSFRKKKLAKEWVDRVRANYKEIRHPFDKRHVDAIRAEAQRETERRLGAR